MTPQHVTQSSFSWKRTFKLLFIVLAGIFVIPTLIYMVSSKSVSTQDREDVTLTEKSETKNQPGIKTKALTEAEVTDFSKEYCDVRNEWESYFPTITVNEEAVGDEKYEINDKGKLGSQLTQADCLNTINYLAYISSEYSPHVTINFDRVVKSQYWIGMNYWEIMFSLGGPDKVNKSNYGGHVQEQWIYRYGPASTNYFYLEGSPVMKVTSYQDY